MGGQQWKICVILYQGTECVKPFTKIGNDDIKLSFPTMLRLHDSSLSTLHFRSGENLKANNSQHTESMA